MTFDPSLLALGGLAAIVTAGWTQVRAVFSQLRSILIVRGHVESGLNAYVSMYLRKEWKRLPTSDIDYGVSYLDIGPNQSTRVVAFRLPPYQVSIFYQGWRFLIWSNNETLITLRGMVDLDNVILKGVDLHYEFMNSRSATNRYFHCDVVGRDSKDTSLRSRSGSDSPTADRAEALTRARSADPQFDTPIGYTREEVLGLDVKQDPFRSLVYSDLVMHHVAQACRWYDQRQWYISRGVPWRRGWGLSGPPGTGKSRLCKALAQKLQIPIYSFHLNTLSDQEFMEEWKSISFPAVVVFEDFDNVFNGRVNVKENSTLSFDCVLNQISGISTNDGLFLIVTTNHPEKLDPAMGAATVGGEGDEEALSSRPGRIDVALHLGYITPEGKRKMAERTLNGWPESVERMANNTRTLTAAQFEELCVREAQKCLAEDERRAALAHLAP